MRPNGRCRYTIAGAKAASSQRTSSMTSPLENEDCRKSLANFFVAYLTMATQTRFQCLLDLRSQDFKLNLNSFQDVLAR
jgi:hypothetical protein